MEAEAKAVAASAELCSAGSTYITALDRYGDVLNSTAPTVGDVKDAGQDLTKPRRETLDAGRPPRTPRRGSQRPPPSSQRRRPRSQRPRRKPPARHRPSRPAGSRA